MSIPYREQADKLFYLPSPQEQVENPHQQIIPFLGAGVSISARPLAAMNPPPQPPSEPRLKALCKILGLEGTSAQLFIRMAAFLAVSMNESEKTSPTFSDDQLLDYLEQEEWPPSARELARLFTNISEHTAYREVVDRLKGLFPEQYINNSEDEQIEMFRRLSRITRIADPPDPLTSITSYYEKKLGRKSLWKNLRSVISTKKTPTLTHRMLAAAAKFYFERKDIFPEDYVILTTNYDCLMEDALDEAGVDYVALATRMSDQKVLVRFSDSLPNAKQFSERQSGKYFPKELFLKKPKNMVIVCKLHGCLNPKLTEQDDGVIISDNDYVNYITQMYSTQGIIPSYVSQLMQDKPFLFLGYSLSDWNVRSVFENIRKRRGREFSDVDYAVTSYVGDYDQLFFDKNNVTILKTDLNTYSSSVVAQLRRRKENNPDKWGELVDRVFSSIPELQTNEAVNAN